MSRLLRALRFTLGGMLFIPIGHSATSGGGNNLPSKPPLPAITSLKLEPSQLTLEDGLDERRILVWAEIENGQRFDVTSEAALKSNSPQVEVGADGYLRPKAKGESVVVVSAAGRQAELKVTVKDAAQPSIRFVRDVEPILSKSGCNAGTCHGSAKGKNGFKLSLRGYDPDFDYEALINDLSGRRFNRVNVDESLMLSKPTGDVPHEGRQAIRPDSRHYRILRQWIAEGVANETSEKGRAQRIEVLPASVELDLPGRQQQVLVIAHYADGANRDVTRESIFSSSNGDVADVKEGLVTGIRRGESAIIVKYEGSFATKLATVMGDRTGYAWTSPEEFNDIDHHVYAKLKKMKILPSDLCSDAEFIRRVSLDLTGLPPTPERVREFLADQSPGKGKREKFLNELIGNKDYIEHWANKWADLLQCNSENLGEKGVAVYRKWIRGYLAQNKPYDEFVRDLLLAQGSAYQNPEVNYYRVLREPGKITEDVSQTFLGVRFNCVKCHDHPFEKWTQNQYYEFGAYFSQIGIKRGTLGRETVFEPTGGLIQVTGEEIVYRKPDGGEVQYPKTGKDVAPKVPYGMAKAVKIDEDRRDSFVAWLTSKDNPLFAKALVNRVWSYFLGRGIIEPVDDIRGSNPASNPALLDALTEDFVKHKFDLRHLMRLICQSRTYQLSIQKNQWNDDDTINFSHASPRRLSAEQIFDAISIATGKPSKFQGLPMGMRSVEIPDGIVAGNDFLALFGRPKRQSACECERTSNVSLSHALNLINGATINETVNAPDNRIAKLVESEKDDKKVVEELYLACLNRPPTEQEVATVDFSQAPRLEVAQDLVWALLNSPAFLFNR